MNRKLLQKFLVVSYDDDQQQWFWDYVAATTEKLHRLSSVRGGRMS